VPRVNAADINLCAGYQRPPRNVKRALASPAFRDMGLATTLHAIHVCRGGCSWKHTFSAAWRHKFRVVSPDEWNRGVFFAGDDDLTLASDNLRAMAIEQAGGYSHQQVATWMHNHGLALDTAADALGISRRMLASYRSGERPIPKTVGLAMLGWEARECGHPGGVR
jgi:hypothetical protein